MAVAEKIDGDPTADDFDVFLHYVLDLWIHDWRKCHAKGEVIAGRYADDFVIGLRNEAKAHLRHSTFWVSPTSVGRHGKAISRSTADRRGSHIAGYRNYETRDESRKNWFVAVITGGEGWHNNHHQDPTSASVQHRWWELDPNYDIIRSLEWVGLASEVVLHKRSSPELK